MNNTDLKQTLYNFCRSYVDRRMLRIQNSISDVQEALTSETKSSSGDKHETGRAMLQLEREKMGQQLAEVEKMGKILAQVPLKRGIASIGLGSLIRTSKAHYYLAISVGEFKTEGQSIFCISGATPIGKLLLGKKVGDVILFNGTETAIEEIL